MSLSSKDQDGTLADASDAHRPVEWKALSAVEEIQEALKLAVKLKAELGIQDEALAAVLEEVNAARERGDEALVLTLGEASAAELAHTSENLFNAVKGKLIDARNLRIDIGEQLRLLKKAKRSLGAGEAYESLRLIAECNSDATRLIWMHKEAQNVIMSSAGLVSEAKRKELDASTALETLLSAKKAFDGHDYVTAHRLANMAREDIEGKLTLHTSAQNIAAARRMLEVAARLNLETAEVKAGLDQAKEAVRTGSHEAALSISTEKRKAIEDIVASEIGMLISQSETSLQMLSEMPAAWQREKLERAREHLERREWSESCELALALRKDLQISLTKKDEAAVAIRNCRDALKEMARLGIDTPETRRLFKKAEEEMRMGMFGAAVATIEGAKAELQSESERGMSATIEAYQSAIDKAKRDGADTGSADSLMEMARLNFRDGSHRQALTLAGQAAAEAERMGKKQDKAAKAILAAEKMMTSDGTPMPAVNRLTSSAQIAFNEGDYERAFELASRAEQIFGDCCRLLDEIRETRLKAEKSAAVAGRIGANATDLEKLLGEARAFQEKGDLVRAKEAYIQGLDWGLGLCRNHMEKLLSEVFEYVEDLKPMGLDESRVVERLLGSRLQLKSGDFEAAFRLIDEGLDEIKSQVSRLSGEIPAPPELPAPHEAVAETDLIEDAALSDYESHRAEESVQASESEEGEGPPSQMEDMQGDSTPEEVATDAQEISKASEETEDLESTFIEFSSRAELAIRNARRIGIKTAEAAKRLSDAIELRQIDISKAIQEAEAANRIVTESVEAFAPRIEATIDIQGAKVGEQIDGTLTLVNTGKSLAKQVKVEILGNAEVEGVLETSGLRAGGETKLPFRVKMTTAGLVDLKVRSTTHSIYDTECLQEAQARIEVRDRELPPAPLVAEKETRCVVCRGSIKKGLKIAICPACGKEFHEMCRTRAKTCPSCRESLAEPV